jgi:aldehyde:ferredoxin oxidoreductase
MREIFQKQTFSVSFAGGGNPMDGFYGRFLKIDLAEKKCDIETINDELLIKYLGGKGLASYLLL